MKARDVWILNHERDGDAASTRAEAAAALAEAYCKQDASSRRGLVRQTIALTESYFVSVLGWPRQEAAEAALAIASSCPLP